MLIGLDVGGTFTDAVLVNPALLDGKGNGGGILRAVKTPTRPESILTGILEALESVLEGVDAEQVERLCVSGTLALNSLLTGQEDPTAVLAISGPGIDPRAFWGEDPLFFPLSGSQDHRGVVVKDIDPEEALLRLREAVGKGARACAVVSKFSPKNSELEKRLRALASREMPAETPIVCGSEAGSVLNFPRRLQTAYCNASLSRISRDFAASLEEAARRLGLDCPVVIMKADAGVFSIEEATADPANTIGSGPAASLMGVYGLLRGLSGTDRCEGQPESADIVMIDMGGTSTDLALMAGGHPLLSRDGLSIAGRRTLVRSLWSRSIPLGGDTALKLGPLRQEGDFPEKRPSWRGRELILDPVRKGPAWAFAPDDREGRPPTLTDAMNLLVDNPVGDLSASREAMKILLTGSSQDGDISGETARELASAYVTVALERIKAEVDSLIREVNEQPVYTIRDLLVERQLQPSLAVCIGGPAEALAELGPEYWDLPAVTPYMAACANAVGAALARPTRMAELYADTMLGRMSIPALGVEEDIPGTYTAEEAGQDLIRALDQAGAETRQSGKAGILYSETFNVLMEGQGRGRIIRVRGQLAPGLLTEAC